MKFISFNINGLRARFHQLAAIVSKYQPEIIGLQETKVSDEDFPLAALQALGYHIYYFGQKGHYGVALLSKVTANKVMKGWPWDDTEAQRRLIAGRFTLTNGQSLEVINGYFPQGESRKNTGKFLAKQQFYTDLSRYLQQHSHAGQPVVVMGDFNIAPADGDVGIGENNAKRWLSAGKCSFLPEERTWYQRLLDWGLVDSFRQHYPEAVHQLSWFDYRSRGFERNPKHGLRIDHILVSQALADCTVDAGIDTDIRAMDKPSDHCPIWLTMDSAIQFLSVPN